MYIEMESSCNCSTSEKTVMNRFSGKNSRPVSILPIMSKIIEKIVFDHINLQYYEMS